MANFKFDIFKTIVFIGITTMAVRAFTLEGVKLKQINDRNKRDTVMTVVTLDTDDTCVLPSVSTTVAPYVHSPPCPNDLRTLTSDTVKYEERSLCPWTNINNTDYNRIPLVLTHAQCQCEHCIRTDGEGFDNTSISIPTCRQIYQTIKVLRECEGSCDNGACRYGKVDERVPVACACIRPIVVD